VVRRRDLSLGRGKESSQHQVRHKYPNHLFGNSLYSRGRSNLVLRAAGVCMLRNKAKCDARTSNGYIYAHCFYIGEQMRTIKTARRAKPVDFISYTPQLLEGMRFSSKEFYTRLEGALAERQVPDLQATRVIWKEGGMLSPGREYLRIQRERYVFDVCAAPFGTGFFVSIWCAERPLRLGFLAWIILLLGSGLLFYAIAQYEWDLTRFIYRNFDAVLSVYTAHLLSVAFIFLTPLLVVAVVVGSHLDLFLLGLPIIGYIYERFFRKITYYRVDMMSMYQASVKAAVKQVIDEISKAQGISPHSEFAEKRSINGLLEAQLSNG
jgi:hypothetical protein